MNIDVHTLKISDHFLARCEERAGFLGRNKRGGEFNLNMRKLELHLGICNEIDRKDSIWRKIKHRGECKYYTQKISVKLKKRMIFVISNNTLITIYPYRDSFADKLS